LPKGANVKVLLVPNYSRPEALEGAATLDAWLGHEGVEVVWAQDKAHIRKPQVDPSDCSLVVSLGGDGTLLRAAGIVGYREIPILGLSYGHLGFLTGAGPEDIVGTIARALSGELHASRRATLDIEIDFDRPDGTSFTDRRFALNDLALTRGPSGDMVEFDVSVSGNHIDRLRGDGFVVSTATGSTGYALSAGGPIVTPDFTGMVCVPIAPHTILARAFLTSSSDVVELVLAPERPVDRSVFVDGAATGADDVAVSCRVRRGEGDVILLDSNAHGFYDAVSRVFYGKVGK
jgi:NAD+ kinase